MEKYLNCNHSNSLGWPSEHPEMHFFVAVCHDRGFSMDIGSVNIKILLVENELNTRSEWS